MRLAVLSTHPIQYQAPLFRELAVRDGVDFTALFCHDHGVAPSLDPEFGKIIRYDVPLLEDYQSRFPRNISPRPSVRPAGMLNPEIALALSRGRYDALVVHGYNYLTSLLALLGPRRHTRVLLRGESHLSPRRPGFVRAVKRATLPILFRRVDHFLAIGSLNREYYRAYGVPEDRITVAPYSVDNRYFAERAATARQDSLRTRQRLCLPQRKVLFVVAAKLIEKKRPFDALNAFARVRRSGADCGMVYVGDGHDREKLEREIAVLGLGDDVSVLGFRNQSQLPELYGCCDVLILASGNEPWGLVVNEGLACGLMAIVSNHVGAGPDLVDPSCIFPAGDIAALATAMLRAATDSDWLRSRRLEAERRMTSWDISHTADGFLSGARQALMRSPRWL
jgi:glycosyltransferase involved in cell wall biosynthesis